MPAQDFNSIEEVAVEIKNKLDPEKEKKKVIALYAFNATGKTRLTGILSKTEDEDEFEMSLRVLSYSAFFEDIFQWDNEECIFIFDSMDKIITLVKEQGLENDIADNFKRITDSKIEPEFNFESGIVTFRNASGDDRSAANIKISRGEESVFVWSIFYSVLRMAIETLDMNHADRSTHAFDDLKYVIIDDPVSSIDDSRIVAITVELVKVLKGYKGSTIRFLVTTHHALFYNILVNSLGGDCGLFYCLFKENFEFKLKWQNDAPFSHHLFVKNIIENAIASDSLERYHFNLFRSLLEKTSNFLGYKKIDDCFLKEDGQLIIRLLNLYSHSKVSDLEIRELSNQDKILFREAFESFVRDFKWNQENYYAD